VMPSRWCCSSRRTLPLSLRGNPDSAPLGGPSVRP
jgi:hypothetical protein